MNIDISQFYETFLAEASEHLADLESGLLEAETSGEADMDSIFRAAHSIKGGAGTFGFDEIAEFTHVVESVLQDARDGLLELKDDVISQLLRSIDVIAELIAAAKEGRKADINTKQDVFEALSAFLGKTAAEIKTKDTDDGTDMTQSDEHSYYSVKFEPHLNMCQTGSDPINIFKELKETCSFSCTCNTSEIPDLNEIDPHSLYLSWEIELETTATQEIIEDAFIFVEDEANIVIEPIAAISLGSPEKIAENSKVALKSKSNGAVKKQGSETAFIRIAVDKVDGLINLIGELVTTNAMVELQMRGIDGEEHRNLINSICEMTSHTRNLQEGIMAIRMMPIEFAFSRFPRMVRDTSQKLNKKINFVTKGGQTELDRTVIEKISDPLTHLVRNSIDHGIETPEERLSAGKSEEGEILLHAYYKGGNVIIDIKDDGKGLDKDSILKKAIEKGLTTEDANLSDNEIYNFIFNNGFSTAKAVTDVSGRGVGMDVVARNIKALNGSISIASVPGKGTTFCISLPLTLAIVDGMATKVGDQTYIIPLLNIIESIRPEKDKIRTLNNNVEMIQIRGEYLPLLRLKETFTVEKSTGEDELGRGIAVIVESEHNKIAIFVDELLGEQQVVIKSLESNYKTVEGVSGATILGDGNVALILDLPGIVRLSQREGRYHTVKKNSKAVINQMNKIQQESMNENTHIDLRDLEIDVHSDLIKHEQPHVKHN
tara:strand:+ start:115525 stop:117672 length:2148 start_codon:yes stop_codon:yes gene_type:complete